MYMHRLFQCLRCNSQTHCDSETESYVKTYVERHKCVSLRYIWVDSSFDQLKAPSDTSKEMYTYVYA